MAASTGSSRGMASRMAATGESINAGVVQTLWIVVVDHIAGGKLEATAASTSPSSTIFMATPTLSVSTQLISGKRAFRSWGGDRPDRQGDPRRARQQMLVGGAAAGDQHKGHVNERIAEGDVGLRLWDQGGGGMIAQSSFSMRFARA